MIYLGQPYTHSDPAVREERFKKGEALLKIFAEQYMPVYSPIVHWHRLSLIPGHKIDNRYWMHHCIDMLSRCDNLLVYCIDGWRESEGLGKEIDFAKRDNIPITYFRGFGSGTHLAEPGAFTRGVKDPESRQN